MKAMRVDRFGGTEVLRAVDLEKPEPGEAQILVKVHLAGVNYFDVYQRTGGTPLSAPFVAGVEGVGTVVELGPGVVDVEVGERVCWPTGGQGSYAEYAVVDVDKTVAVPRGIDDETAVALMMQGLTAHYLASDAYPVKPQDTVLVHAAAGGVGQLLTQIVRLRGGRVLGTTSTDSKAAVVRQAGAAHVFSYDGFVRQVHEATDGVGVAAVYDGVGAATFDGSIQALRRRGTLVVYGTASGATPALDIPRLNTGGSLYVTRPSLVDYIVTAAELRSRVAELFRWVASGELQVLIGGRFDLAEAAAAQEALMSRATSGKLLIRVDANGAAVGID